MTVVTLIMTVVTLNNFTPGLSMPHLHGRLSFKGQPEQRVKAQSNGVVTNEGGALMAL
jgi:hypothetical protein